MPRDDAVGFTRLNAVKGFIELRSAFRHRTLALLKAADDIEAVLLDQVADFGKLVADTAGLALFGTCRFANVNEESVMRLFHADTLARKTVGAKGVWKSSGIDEARIHNPLSASLKHALQKLRSMHFQRLAEANKDDHGRLAFATFD